MSTYSVFDLAGSKLVVYYTNQKKTKNILKEFSEILKKTKRNELCFDFQFKSEQATKIAFSQMQEWIMKLKIEYMVTFDMISTDNSIVKVTLSGPDAKFKEAKEEIEKLLQK